MLKTKQAVEVAWVYHKLTGKVTCNCLVMAQWIRDCDCLDAREPEQTIKMEFP